MHTPGLVAAPTWLGRQCTPQLGPLAQPMQPTSPLPFLKRLLLLWAASGLGTQQGAPLLCSLANCCNPLGGEYLSMNAALPSSPSRGDGTPSSTAGTQWGRPHPFTVGVSRASPALQLTGGSVLPGPPALYPLGVKKPHNPGPFGSLGSAGPRRCEVTLSPGVSLQFPALAPGLCHPPLNFPLHFLTLIHQGR